MFRTTVCDVNLRLPNSCRLDGGGVRRTSTFDLIEFCPNDSFRFDGGGVGSTSSYDLIEFALPNRIGNHFGLYKGYEKKETLVPT